MTTYSDEPQLIQPSRRLTLKHWLGIALTLLVAGGIAYIPINESRLNRIAHDAPRGPRQGTLHNISIEGRPHTIELAWHQDRFAILLAPAPAPGTTLRISGRFGSETLAWNDTLGAFGPGTTLINPLSHYELSLSLVQNDRTLWSDTLWAYGYQDHHGHSH